MLLVSSDLVHIIMNLFPFLVIIIVPNIVSKGEGPRDDGTVSILEVMVDWKDNKYMTMTQ